MPQMFDLTGCVAFVAGATRGIGWSIAAQYVQHGGHVTIASRDFEACRERAESLNAAAGEERAWPCQFDLMDAQSIDAAMDAANARWCGLTTLVANSYISVAGPVDRTDAAAFTDVLRGNIVQNARLAQVALPSLRKSRLGSVVFIGSASGLAPSPSMAAYGIAKCGLHQLARNLAVEWGPMGVRVNVVAPGMTRTPVVMHALSEEEQMRRAQSWPIARLGEPDEIAAAAIFLASRAAGFTTGAILACDGGRTLLSGNSDGALALE